MFYLRRIRRSPHWCSEIHLVLRWPVYNNTISASTLQTVGRMQNQGMTQAGLKKRAGRQMSWQGTHLLEVISYRQDRCMQQSGVGRNTDMK